MTETNNPKPLSDREADRVIRQSVAKLASPGSGGFSIDDLAQAVWMAMLSSKAGIPSKPRLLATVAKYRAIDAIRADSVRRCFSLDCPVGDEGNATVIDKLEGLEVDSAPVDPRAALIRQFALTLDGRAADVFQRNMLTAKGDLGHATLTELATEHGVSKQALALQKKKLTKRLAAYLA